MKWSATSSPNTAAASANDTLAAAGDIPASDLMIVVWAKGIVLVNISVEWNTFRQRILRIAWPFGQSRSVRFTGASRNEGLTLLPARNRREPKNNKNLIKAHSFVPLDA